MAEKEKKRIDTPREAAMKAAFAAMFPEFSPLVGAVSSGMSGWKGAMETKRYHDDLKAAAEKKRKEEEKARLDKEAEERRKAALPKPSGEAPSEIPNAPTIGPKPSKKPYDPAAKNIAKAPSSPATSGKSQGMRYPVDQEREMAFSLMGLDGYSPYPKR